MQATWRLLCKWQRKQNSHHLVASAFKSGRFGSKLSQRVGGPAAPQGGQPCSCCLHPGPQGGEAGSRVSPIPALMEMQPRGRGPYRAEEACSAGSQEKLLARMLLKPRAEGRKGCVSHLLLVSVTKGGPAEARGSWDRRHSPPPPAVAGAQRLGVGRATGRSPNHLQGPSGCSGEFESSLEDHERPWGGFKKRPRLPQRRAMPQAAPRGADRVRQEVRREVTGQRPGRGS